MFHYSAPPDEIIFVLFNDDAESVESGVEMLFIGRICAFFVSIEQLVDDRPVLQIDRRDFLRNTEVSHDSRSVEWDCAFNEDIPHSIETNYVEEGLMEFVVVFVECF